MSFLQSDRDVQGNMSLELLSFRSRSSMHMINRYPAMGSPCLQPLPTLILGVGKPFMRMEDWKFLRREFIQWMYFGENPKVFRVFSMNLKDMLS